MALSGTEKIEQYLASQGAIDAEEHALLGEVAYVRLIDAIRHAGLKPGEPLSKNRISKAMGISRTPVREAIQRLAQEGLIEIIPGRMITIAAPSLGEVLDAIDVRQRLEPWLASLVAGNLSPKAVAQMHESLDIMSRAAQEDDRSAWSKADTIYHELLSEYCPNQFLGDIVLQARNRVLRTFTDDYFTTQKYIIDGTEEHREIAEVIIQGDSEKAEELMHRHVQNVRANLLRRFK